MSVCLCVGVWVFDALIGWLAGCQRGRDCVCLCLLCSSFMSCLFIVFVLLINSLCCYFNQKIFLSQAISLCLGVVPCFRLFDLFVDLIFTCICYYIFSYLFM